MLYRLFVNLKVLLKKNFSLNCWNKDVNFLFYAYAQFLILLLFSKTQKGSSHPSPTLSTLLASHINLGGTFAPQGTPLYPPLCLPW